MDDRAIRAALQRHWEASDASDFEVEHEIYQEDAVLDYPQSGERIRGHANERAIADNYPGGLPEIDPGSIIGSEDRWVISPSFTYERVVGSGDTWFVHGTALYPNGSTWLVVTIVHLRDGLIHRETTWWAEPFEAPAWRAQWVERLEPQPGNAVTS